MHSLSAAFLAVATAVACAGCAPSLQSVVETYPNGRTKTSYSYYVDADGKKALQGEMLQWPPPGGPTGLATRSVYDHGKLVGGPSEAAVTE